jgi:thiamine-phosphate pyrophosphorylase
VVAVEGPRQALAVRLGQPPPALYGLLDSGLLLEDRIPGCAVELADAGVEILQLRAKDYSTRRFMDLALNTMAALRGRKVPLIINDRVDVALAAGAAGVHLGRDDLAPVDARRLLGEDRVVGVTAHDQAELAEVTPDLADYVGYGAIFGTNTRSGATICGPEALTAAVAASTLPVVAIGGIAPDNVEALRESGVSAVAAASSLVSGRTRPGAVEEFLRVLRAW